jgi:hypothetical protein
MHLKKVFPEKLDFNKKHVFQAKTSYSGKTFLGAFCN